MSFESDMSLGEAYERYLMRRFQSEGYHLERYTTRDDQLNYGDLRLGAHGEGATGVEVKYDRRFHKTGNCFIEVAARHHATDPTYWPGSLKSPANWSWLWIGDYRDLFMFKRKDLLELLERDEVRVFEISGGTSHGFLLDERQRKSLAVGDRHWPDRLPLGKRSPTRPSSPK